MEKTGILVVTYGSRGAAIVDALERSDYDVEFYIADKQKNPFNAKRAKEHIVIPDLNVQSIADFAKKHADKINFGIVGSEGPVIDGVKCAVEKSTGIPMVCPTREMAIEESKLRQRVLLAQCCPEANPRYRVYRKEDYKSESEMKEDLYSWLDVLENQVAVKPDRPGYGKGVGVWKDHFNTRDELYEHFKSIYESDAVIVEEKIYGEESSLQCFCDGKKIVCAPDVRDYKRAFEGDEGQNTGGMGSYKDSKDYLPFMSPAERDKEIEIANKLFTHLKKEENGGKGSENPYLRGISLYLAFIHSKSGPKILEINSRGGDPELMNILPVLKNDFVDVCFDMIEGSMKNLKFDDKATVVTYKVPPKYGCFIDRFPEKVNTELTGTPIDLGAAENLPNTSNGTLRIYPGSMKLETDGKNYALGSRTVACVGIGGSIEEARGISLEAINAIKGGELWYRTDIASREHIQKSIENRSRF